MAKVQFPSDIPTPISETLHHLIEECGYELTIAAEKFEYVNGRNMLTFSTLFGLVYRQYNGLNWVASFTFKPMVPVEDADYAQLLIVTGAIKITNSASFLDFRANSIHQHSNIIA